LQQTTQIEQSLAIMDQENTEMRERIIAKRKLLKDMTY